MGLQFLFMDDSAPCHRTVVAEQLLESRRLAARTLLTRSAIPELRIAAPRRMGSNASTTHWHPPSPHGQTLCETRLCSQGRSYSLLNDRIVMLAGQP
ncbi:hypothetical protein TNCV_3146241 [Trichonephila clavipes]|nr:hypothetical protein TNCV_3146241 [Trichonephila clavipes]